MLTETQNDQAWLDDDAVAGAASFEEVMETMRDLEVQEAEIREERRRIAEQAAAFKPQMLEQIRRDVEQYMTLMNGTIAEVLDALPVLKVTPTRNRKATPVAPAKRSGGWKHAVTGIIYKGGKLPTALVNVMANDGVNLNDPKAKKEWIEANCEKVSS